MKIQSSNTKQIYIFSPDDTKQEGRYVCPECSQSRKKNKERVMAWDLYKNRGYCHHCMTAFFEYKPYEAKQYNIPEWKNKTDLTDKAVKWFEGRMISQDTLKKLKIYSDAEVMPQFNKSVDVICFPYFRDGNIVNIKFRGPEKSFKMVSGAELIFWNFDVLKNCEKVIITEGEIDALTFIENGFNNVISVPNGANKNLEYLDNCIGLFDSIKEVYLATDADTKGIELRDELIRRIGPEKCHTASFKDCKDANEYFTKYGGVEFKDIQMAPPNIKGIVNIDGLYNDIRLYFNEGSQKGLSVDNPVIDKYITWLPGLLVVCTGLPSSGKSEFIDYIVIRLNLLNNWKAAFFTPENYPLKYHYSKLFEKLIGKRFQKEYSNDVEFDMAWDYITQNFFYILNEEDMSIQTILQNAKFLVKQKGIKVLVIDPYNKVEHRIEKSMTETMYVSWFLDQLQTFARLNEVMIILIAHPAKMQKGDVPNLYSISGSAHFYNKCDIGLTVHRMTDDNNIMQNEIQVHWQKVRFKNLGEQGISDLKYNYNNGRFEHMELTVDNWDNSNWLINGKDRELLALESEGSAF